MSRGNELQPSNFTSNPNITITYGQMTDGSFAAISYGESKNVMFVGVSEGTKVISRMVGDNVETINLLTTAVNNRTRQRNYFRLYNQLLLNEISEEDFYRTIEENEDDYMIEELNTPSKDLLEIALSLCRNIKDVNNSEDFADLFSFNCEETDKLLAEVEENGGIQ